MFFNKNKTKNNNIVKSGILGVAIGDALGVPFEFKTRYSYKFNCKNNMQGFGAHNQPPGSWSDDTSLTLATLDSLISGYDFHAIGDEFWNWYYHGKYSVDNELPFDCGVTVAKSIIHMKVNNYNANTSFKENGNGSLMRILPIVYEIHFNNINDEAKFKMIKEVSSITHSHVISIIGCAIYVEFCLQLLKGETIDTAYKNMQSIISKEYYEHKKELELYEDILIGDVRRLDCEDIKSSGYVVDSLKASLWCFMTNNNFEDTLLTAVNLGGDTDTIGAIAGGIAGLYYGYSKIPKGWLRTLRNREYIESMCDNYRAKYSN